MDIANKLKISQGSVPNCLNWAKNRGYLTTPKPVFSAELIPADLMAKVSSLVHHDDLRKAVKDFVSVNRGKDLAIPVIRVFPSGSRRVDGTAWRSRLNRFAQASGSYIADLIRQSKTVGISWGATVASVVSAIEGQGKSPSAQTRIIPLGGEPLGAPLNLASSSSLAARMQLAFGSSFPTLSLAAVPALIPLAFKTSREVQTIRSLIDMVRDYGTIYSGLEGRPGLVEVIDCVLCSVSPADRVWGDDLVRSGQFDVEDLTELVHGDLCGVLLSRNGKEKQVSSLSERWTCVQIRHLQACMKRASGNPKSPGIVVVAIGANKAKCVLECLHRNLINHLVIDDDLADELHKLATRWVHRMAIRS